MFLERFSNVFILALVCVKTNDRKRHELHHELAPCCVYSRNYLFHFAIGKVKLITQRN